MTANPSATKLFHAAFALKQPTDGFRWNAARGSITLYQPFSFDDSP
jgi:hypothetical protein